MVKKKNGCVLMWIFFWNLPPGTGLPRVHRAASLSSLAFWSNMSLLDGPLNVLGQRTTGDSVRTQNGERFRHYSGTRCGIFVVLWGKGWMVALGPGRTRGQRANANQLRVRFTALFRLVLSRCEGVAHVQGPPH